MVFHQAQSSKVPLLPAYPWKIVLLVTRILKKTMSQGWVDIVNINCLSELCLSTVLLIILSECFDISGPITIIFRGFADTKPPFGLCLGRVGRYTLPPDLDMKVILPSSPTWWSTMTTTTTTTTKEITTTTTTTTTTATMSTLKWRNMEWDGSHGMGTVKLFKTLRRHAIPIGFMGLGLLLGGFSPTHLKKYANRQIGFHFPKDRSEDKTFETTT